MLGDELIDELRAAAGRDDDPRRSDLLWEAMEEIERQRNELVYADLAKQQAQRWANEAWELVNELKERLRLIEDAYEEDVMAVARARRTP